MKRLGQSGFLLAEFAVGMGLSSVLAAIVVTAVYQLNRASDDGAARLETLAEVQKATLWLSRDVRRASTTDLNDGGPAASAASFDWTESGGPVHTCVYALIVSELRRTCDGATSVAARAVSALSFSRVGSLVAINYTITPAGRPGYAEAVSLMVAMRPQ